MNILESGSATAAVALLFLILIAIVSQGGRKKG